MSENREDRITFRIDPETSAALNRLLEASKRKKSEVVHEALHRFLLENDQEYRETVLGNSRGSYMALNPLDSALVREAETFPDAGTAEAGSSSPGKKKSKTA